MSFDLDPFGDDLLCWSPDEEDWFMVLAGEPGQWKRLHEAHFAMTKEGLVWKNRHGSEGHPENDRLREEGLKLLGELQC